MRNLKKILALVLALVMSLSLMATASAAESTAAAGDYALASKVLQGLDVVRGDDGGIREADSITRAEAAALAYRIHTADVKDTQANLYYDLQDAAFTDLAPVSAWALGYIGYAHNAQIVKGNGNGTFNPTGNITGYEILAMALRSIGYGKNGEFEGAEWQINTAAWARREGLLEGVTPADQVRLDLPATRGMVFQILFNAIQHADQQLSYVTGDLYIDATGANNTMALRLGLDKITGVVMANEWAALDADSVMAEGKTRLLAADNTSYTVDHSTELEDIGESRIVYIRDDKTVLDIADAGNTVKDNNGEKTTVNSLKDSLNINDAEHFINFGYSTKDTSEWIIRYVIDAGYVVDGVWTAEPWYNVNNSWYTYLTGMTTTVGDKYASWTWSDAAKTQPLTVTVTIRPETQISATDKAIMKEIFYSADRYAANPDNDWVNYWVNGEVYVGTSSLEDKSDKMNWNDFWKTYVETDETQPITEAGNGEWLKIIDNNGDGKAEYVLLTEYVLDKVIDSTTKNDATTYYYNALDITKWTYKTHTGYEPKVGDIVLYALIDGTVQMQLADTATAAFRAVDYKERQAKTADGDTYEQSDISNETKLPSELVEVDENVEYTLYLDKYGYVRAYSNETRYALITEVYPTNGMNQAWVTDHSLTAEVMKAGEKTIKEYSIANNWYSNRYNPFYIGDNRNWNGALNTTRPNWLQPATHSLDWSVAEGNREFIFNNSATEVNHSWTNVAKYTPGSDEKSINLFTAADRTNGNRHEDYIQLAINNVSSKEPLYAINDVDYPNTTSNPNDHYVRAVDDTIFFVVSREDGRIGEVRQYVGYSNVVNLDVAKNGIHAMYAVAVNSNTDVDTNAHDYWTADVIVIEIEHFDDAFESVALIYSNDSKISGDVKYLQVLDSAKGYIGIIPNNYDIWRSQFNNYGFWGLKNIEATDDASIFTADIYPIHTASYTDHYALNMLCGDYGIGFGRVRSTNEELERSTYITVDVMGNENTNDVEKTTTVRLADKYGYAWSINDASAYYNEAGELIFGGHGSNRVNHGDYILWVNVPGTSNNTVGFIVDLSDKHVTSAHGWDNPDFLGSITARIADEQNTTNNPVVDPTVTIDITGAAATINGTAVVSGVAYPYATGTELTIEVRLDAENDTLTVDGVDVTGQIVDGVYTCTLTITGNNEITIVGSSGKIEGIPVDYQGVPVNGGVAVVPESNTLTVGTDIPDPSDASLAEMVEGKLGVWVYVNEMAEENEIKAVDGVYTIPETATKVIVFYGNDTTEAPDEPTNPDNPDTPDNPDDWTPVEPLSAAATIAGRAAGIQTLDLPTATFTFWYFVPSTQDITTATVFNNGVTTNAGEPKVATEAEIAAVCERNASIKSNLDEKWAADPNGKVGYVTFTYVTGDHTVTPDVRTKAVAPVETDDTIQAIIDRGTYNFYRYASEAALTDDQVKAALTNALNELWSTKSVSSIALDHSKGKATVTWSDGTESKIDYNKEGNAKIGSYLHPELLYKVTYEGTVLGYKKADSRSAVTFDVAGINTGDYAIREGEMIANTATTADEGKKFVTAKDGQLDIKVERPAEGYDVNYAKAVAFTVDIGTSATTLTTGDTVASTDAKFPTGGTSNALTIAAGKIVVCEKNVYLRFTEGAAGTTGKKYTLTVNGTAVDSTAKIGDGSTTLKFDIAASTLTPDKAGEIKIGLKESSVVDGVKVRIGQLDGTVAEAVDAVVGSDDQLYAVMSEELAGADVKWGIVNWTGVTPTFVLITAPSDTPAYKSAVDGFALDITSAKRDPDGCVWILPFVQVTIDDSVAVGSIDGSNRTVSFEDYTGTETATNFESGVYVPVGATMELMSDTTNTRLSTTIGGKTEGIGIVGTDGSAAKATLKVTKAVTVTEDEVLRKLTIALNNDRDNVRAGDKIGDIKKVWKLAGNNKLLTHVNITFVDENGYELNNTNVTVGESEFGIQINFAKAVFAGYVVDGSVSVDIKGYKGGLVTFGTGTLEENPDGSWTINAWLDGSKLA